MAHLCYRHLHVSTKCTLLKVCAPKTLSILICRTSCAKHYTFTLQQEPRPPSTTQQLTIPLFKYILAYRTTRKQTNARWHKCRYHIQLFSLLSKNPRLSLQSGSIVTTQLLSREPQSSSESAISRHLYSKKTCAQYLQLCIKTNVLVLCSILYMVKNSRLGIYTLTRAYLSSCTVTVSTNQFLLQWLVALSEFVVQC